MDTKKVNDLMVAIKIIMKQYNFSYEVKSLWIYYTVLAFQKYSNEGKKDER